MTVQQLEKPKEKTEKNNSNVVLLSLNHLQRNCSTRSPIITGAAVQNTAIASQREDRDGKERTVT